MPNETLEQDPLEYVRLRLRDMPPIEMTRLALHVGMTQRTVYNVLKGERGAKYDTVMKLHKALKEAQAAEVVAKP